MGNLLPRDACPICDRLHCEMVLPPVPVVANFGARRLICRKCWEVLKREKEAREKRIAESSAQHPAALSSAARE